MAERQARRASDLPGDITRRELYFFNLYRLLEAVVYTGLVFSPAAVNWIKLSHPTVGHVASLGYLAAALVLLFLTDRMRRNMNASIGFALTLDSIAASLVLFSIAGGHSSIPMMLMVNVGVSALLLPFRQSQVLAILAAIGIVLPSVFSQLFTDVSERSSCSGRMRTSSGRVPGANIDGTCVNSVAERSATAAKRASTIDWSSSSDSRPSTTRVIAFAE